MPAKNRPLERKIMSDVSSILGMIKENDIRFVDLRFTDPRGKWQHLTQALSTIDEESLVEGFMFDGSSTVSYTHLTLPTKA